MSESGNLLAKGFSKIHRRKVVGRKKKAVKRKPIVVMFRPSSKLYTLMCDLAEREGVSVQQLMKYAVEELCDKHVPFH